MLKYQKLAEKALTEKKERLHIKYHSRLTYEILLVNTCKQANYEIPKKYSEWPDFLLLDCINTILKECNCTSLSLDELEMELL